MFRIQASPGQRAGLCPAGFGAARVWRVSEGAVPGGQIATLEALRERGGLPDRADG